MLDTDVMILGAVAGVAVYAGAAIGVMMGRTRKAFRMIVELCDILDDLMTRVNQAEDALDSLRCKSCGGWHGPLDRDEDDDEWEDDE